MIAGGFLAESHTDFADLHAGDDYHGNDNGYFLSAAVYYAKIYDADSGDLIWSRGFSSY